MTSEKPGRVRWVLIIWIFIMSSVSYCDRVNISIARTYLLREFHFSDIQIGYIFTIFLIGYALFQAPGGRIADRYGPRRVMTAYMAWFAVFVALVTIIPSSLGAALVAFAAVRFLLGSGEAVLFPGSNRLVAKWIPSNERGKANGFIFAGVGVGAGMSSPLVTYIMLHGGWRLSFWLNAALGLLVGVVWYLLARDKPEDHPWVKPAELNLIRAGLPDAGQAPKGILPWSTIFSSRDFLLVTYSYFCYGYTSYIFFAWFFPYLTSVRGLSLRESSYLTALPFFAMALCSPTGGLVSDFVTRHHGKRWGRCGIAVLGIALCGMFMACGHAVGNPRLASVVLAAAAGSLFFSQSTYWSVSADIAGESAGSVSGIMNMGGQIGGAVTATLTPYIAHTQGLGWGVAFGVAAFLCATGALAWLRVDPNRKLAPPAAA